MQIKTNQIQKEMKEHGAFSFPLLVSEECLSHYESGSFLWHWHPEIEITYVTSGELVYHVNHLSFHLKEGDALFGNANTLHSGHRYQNHDCHYISVTFDPKIIYGFEHSAIQTKYVSIITQNLSFCAASFSKDQKNQRAFLEKLTHFLSLYNKKLPYPELSLTVALQEIWLELLQYQQDIPALTHQEAMDYQRIRSILDYLSENYQHKISLEDIANDIHLCSSECCRLFKRSMHMSLFSFLQEYRIEKSLLYLSDSSYSITDIASLVGFSDSNYYSKVFAKMKGCSPRVYRKRMATVQSSSI